MEGVEEAEGFRGCERKEVKMNDARRRMLSSKHERTDILGLRLVAQEH